MLGSTFPFSQFSVIPKATRLHSALRTNLFSVIFSLVLANSAAIFAQAPPLTPLRPPTAGGEATLEADQQRQVGKIFYADGHVDVRYENVRLRADHVEYDSDTQVVMARGHVQLDYVTQHVEADEARYELRTGRGSFKHVHATFAIQRRPEPTLLISPNPLYFEAEEADRVDENTYHVQQSVDDRLRSGPADLEILCAEATVELRKSIRLENGNFRLLSVPDPVSALRDLPCREGTELRVYDSASRRKLQQGLYPRRRILLGAD